MGSAVHTVSVNPLFARDDAQTRMLALKEKADKELAQYNMELKVCAWSEVLGGCLQQTSVVRC